MFSQDLVSEFMEATGQMMNSYPTIDVPEELKTLRRNLIAEEASEVFLAIASGTREEVAKELVDLLYVVYGTGSLFGMDLEGLLAEVHRSNMTKLVDGKPLVREDGKVLKGPNYREPDMEAALVSLDKETFIHVADLATRETCVFGVEDEQMAVRVARMFNGLEIMLKGLEDVWDFDSAEVVQLTGQISHDRNGDKHISFDGNESFWMIKPSIV